MDSLQERSPSQSKRSFHLNIFQKFHKEPASPETPVKIELEKSDAVLIKSKKHTLLYRLFHSEDDTTSESNMSKNSSRKTSDLIYDSEESDYSSGCSQPNSYTSKQKSHSNLMDFFKQEQRKELPFLFKHLKKKSESNLDSHETLSEPSSLNRNSSLSTFCEKYGWVEKKCVGKGANGVVRLAHKTDPTCPTMEKLYAIKEFRKKNKNETERSYIKKLTSEFCIGSSLHHENVIETVDLIQNDQHQWCEVLEYCAGGDLCNLIQNKHLTPDEANTFFNQLIHGVAYIHSMGVAHRDLKPENLMLDYKGCLKITDFGEAEVFQGPYERCPHKSKRCCGSQPYMAPEEFTEKEFDPRPIDIFACGIIYLAMIYNRLPWKKPHADDPNYRHYLNHLEKGFVMIDRLPSGPRHLIRKILNPDPSQRPSMEEILKDAWFIQIDDLIELGKKIQSQSSESTLS